MTTWCSTKILKVLDAWGFPALCIVCFRPSLDAISTVLYGECVIWTREGSESVVQTESDVSRGMPEGEICQNSG